MVPMRRLPQAAFPLGGDQAIGIRTLTPNSLAAHAAAEGGGAGELEDVALRVAAADAVGHGRKAAEEHVGGGVVAAAESGERAGGREADEAGHVLVGAG